MNNDIFSHDISYRLRNILELNDLDTFEKCLNLPKWEFLQFRNGGKKSLEELKTLLQSHPGFENSIFAASYYFNNALLYSNTLSYAEEIKKLQKQTLIINKKINGYKRRIKQNITKLGILGSYIENNRDVKELFL